MAIYARVQAGVVMELFTTSQPIASLFQPSIVWADVTTASPAVQVGWLAQSGGTFALPAAAPVATPALTLGTVQTQLVALQAQVAALVAAAAAH